MEIIYTRAQRRQSLKVFPSISMLGRNRKNAFAREGKNGKTGELFRTLFDAKETKIGTETIDKSAGAPACIKYDRAPTVRTTVTLTQAARKCVVGIDFAVLEESAVFEVVSFPKDQGKIVL